MRKTLSVFLLLFAVCACNPSPHKDPNIFRREKRYSQGFKVDAAWIALEWGGKLNGFGSGFLIDRAKGAFYTNRHVSNIFDSLGKDSHKLFFNERVYNTEIVRTLTLTDASLIRITGSFDFSGFPEPAPISKEKVKIGDKVVIEGFHPHPYWVREADNAAGCHNILVPILRDYYEMNTRFVEKDMEIVFEKLSAQVVNLNVEGVLQVKPGDIAGEARNRSNLYIQIKTDRDHRFSFGGLSGSAVRNLKGEVIGIVTLEKSHFRPDQKKTEEKQDGQMYLVQVFDTVLVTPIESVEVLRQYLK